MRTIVGALAAAALLAAARPPEPTPTPPGTATNGAAGAAGAPAGLLYPGEEKFLANVRQLTFGGQNAEAYWAADGSRLIFQSDEAKLDCDQISTMNADGSNRRRVSTGGGRTTCSYFFPSGDRILYASTRRGGEACPPKPDRSHGYVWALDDFDIWTARPDGSDAKSLFASPAYDAEATISPDGRTIVFFFNDTATTEIYTMDASGGNVKRLTHTPGYDGGPFFSDDGKRIVYRADHPESAEDLAKYRENLARGVYAPRALELRIMDADGGHDRAITSNGAANFAPYFLPGNREIIFSSNMDDPQRRDFDLYLIKDDGTGLTRVTRAPAFDGFPMLTRDGRRIVWASNRNGSKPHETNVFVADWVWTGR